MEIPYGGAVFAVSCDDAQRRCVSPPRPESEVWEDREEILRSVEQAIAVELERNPPPRVEEYRGSKLVTDIGHGGLTRVENPSLFVRFPQVTEELLAQCEKECLCGSSTTSLQKLCEESRLRPTVFFTVAAGSGRISVCEFLLQNGFLIDGDPKTIKGYFGEEDEEEVVYEKNPLSEAICALNIEAVQWLLDHGANPCADGADEKAMYNLRNKEDYDSDDDEEAAVAIFRLVVEDCLECYEEEFDAEYCLETFCCKNRPYDYPELFRWLVEKMPESVVQEVKETYADILHTSQTLQNTRRLIQAGYEEKIRTGPEGGSNLDLAINSRTL